MYSSKEYNPHVKYPSYAIVKPNNNQVHFEDESKCLTLAY